MKTLKTVFMLECRILRRDRAAMTVLAVFSAFLLIAAFAGGRHASTLEEGFRKVKQEQSSRLNTLSVELKKLAGTNAALGNEDPRNTVWMAQEGAAQFALLPPAPLAPIAMGQRDLHPQAVRVTNSIHLIRERETETPMAGPTRLRTGPFDPAFLFVVLFPLVIIALSYELLSGERERGTLAMLLSQPVSQSALVMGKASARGAVLSLVTLALALAGLVVAGAELDSGAAWSHVGLYALILILWGVFWFATAIAVNSRGGTSAKNALVLVGLWLVLVVIIPGLFNAGVNSIYPPPSRVELLHEAREVTQETEAELNNLVGRHDVNPKRGDLAKKVVLVQDELAKRSAPVLEELNAQLQKRQMLMGWLQYASPAILVQLALEDVAGSGATRHHSFREQADAYHTRFRAFFSERIQAGNRFSLKDFEAIPVFRFEEAGLWGLASRVIVSSAVLLLAALALLMIARPGLRRIGRQ
jgi:ABC-2 type transport system permease protein